MIAANRERLPIIGLDANDWHGPWMNRQHILSRFAARGWPVLYSRGPLYSWERGHERWRNAPWLGRFSTADGVLLDEAGRLPLRVQRIPAWDRYVLWRYAARLTKRIDARPGGRFIVHIFNPELGGLVPALDPAFLVLHVRDYYPGIGDWTARRQSQLEALSDRAALIVVSDRCMIDALPQRHRGRARELQNAASFTTFGRGPSLPTPPDLAPIPHPRIGYAGALSLKFDWALVGELAARRPAWQWVLLGPLVRAGDPAHALLAERTLALPNIHWLGLKPYRALPAYVGHCDANVLPYRVDSEETSWVRYVNPLKLHEYLSSGRPVVGAEIPSVRRLASVIAIPDRSGGADAWESALDEALSRGGRGTPTARRRVATANTWEARMRVLEAWYREMLRGTSRA